MTVTNNLWIRFGNLLITRHLGLLLLFEFLRLRGKHSSQSVLSTNSEFDLISRMVLCRSSYWTRFAGVYQSILDLLCASIKLNEHLNPLMD